MVAHFPGDLVRPHYGGETAGASARRIRAGGSSSYGRKPVGAGGRIETSPEEHLHPELLVGYRFEFRRW